MFQPEISTLSDSQEYGIWGTLIIHSSTGGVSLIEFPQGTQIKVAIESNHEDLAHVVSLGECDDYRHLPHGSARIIIDVASNKDGSLMTVRGE